MEVGYSSPSFAYDVGQLGQAIPFVAKEGLLIAVEEWAPVHSSYRIHTLRLQEWVVRPVLAKDSKSFSGKNDCCDIAFAYSATLLQ